MTTLPTDAEQIVRLLADLGKARAENNKLCDAELERDEARHEVKRLRRDENIIEDQWDKEQAKNARLRDHIDWMRQTVHRAHHDQLMETCEKSTCQGSRRALKDEP